LINKKFDIVKAQYGVVDFIKKDIKTSPLLQYRLAEIPSMAYI